jgi:hypothetical protein
MLIAFILNDALNEQLSLHKEGALYEVKRMTGCSDIEYHRGNRDQPCCKRHVFHIVLTDPTLGAEEINKQLANNAIFKDYAVWEVV